MATNNLKKSSQFIPAGGSQFFQQKQPVSEAQKRYEYNQDGFGAEFNQAQGQNFNGGYSGGASFANSGSQYSPPVQQFSGVVPNMQNTPPQMQQMQGFGYDQFPSMSSSTSAMPGSQFQTASAAVPGSPQYAPQMTTQANNIADSVFKENGLVSPNQIFSVPSAQPTASSNLQLPPDVELLSRSRTGEIDNDFVDFREKLMFAGAFDEEVAEFDNKYKDNGFKMDGLSTVPEDYFFMDEDDITTTETPPLPSGTEVKAPDVSSPVAAPAPKATSPMTSVNTQSTQPIQSPIQSPKILQSGAVLPTIKSFTSTSKRMFEGVEIDDISGDAEMEAMANEGPNADGGIAFLSDISLNS